MAKKYSLKKLKRRFKPLLKYVYFVLLLLFILLVLNIYRNHINDDIKAVSPGGVSLLNNYEGLDILPWVETSSGYCLPAYDVGDGVVTFGFGNTFVDETTGIDYINDLVGGSYSVGDCINYDDLITLQQDALDSRTKRLIDIANDHFMKLTQEQFDALMLMFYLNESTIYDDRLWKLLKSDDSSYDSYVNYFVNEFSTFDNWDVYGDGWTKRIEDSADLYYYGDYNRDY